MHPEVVRDRRHRAHERPHRRRRDRDRSPGFRPRRSERGRVRGVQERHDAQGHNRHARDGLSQMP